MMDRSAEARRLLSSEDFGRSHEGTVPADEESRLTKIKHLSAVELFRDLSAKEMAEVESATVMWNCRSGHIFYKPGEASDVLFILKQGQVQIYRKSDRGRKLVIAQLRPYSLFGEMACLGQHMYHKYAMATEDSLVCTMKRADVEQLLLSRPKVALRFIQAISERFIQVEQRLEDFAFRDAKSRVAAFLLRVADDGEIRGFRHQDIADSLGVFRETVTDALAELKDSGAITIERKHIRILDQRRLQERAS